MKNLFYLSLLFTIISCGRDSTVEIINEPNTPNTKLVKKLLITQTQGGQSNNVTYMFKYNVNGKVEKVLIDNDELEYQIIYNSKNKPTEFIYFGESNKYNFQYDSNNKLVSIISGHINSSETKKFDVTFSDNDNTIRVSTSDNYGNISTQIYNFENLNLTSLKNGYSNIGTVFTYDKNENPFYYMFDREIFLTNNLDFRGFGDKEYMSKNIINKSESAHNIYNYTNIYDTTHHLIKSSYGDNYEFYQMAITY